MLTGNNTNNRSYFRYLFSYMTLDKVILSSLFFLFIALSLCIRPYGLSQSQSNNNDIILRIIYVRVYNL